MPTASDVPPLSVVHQETPSPLNAFGVKGLGEGGAIAPPVVIANAVCDALRPFKAELNSTPVRWSQVAAFFRSGHLISLYRDFFACSDSLGNSYYYPVFNNRKEVIECLIV